MDSEGTYLCLSLIYLQHPLLPY
uniref:Uncharacterized protein n=1 Tax=Rhizophora mucronata TaxID=61149 RepID=A0A2P2QYY8_RHIMU